MKLLRVTSNGRVTIPVSLREMFGFHPGRKVKFESDEDGIRIIPLVTKEEIRANAGFLEMKGRILKSFKEEKKKEREL